MAVWLLSLLLALVSAEGSIAINPQILTGIMVMFIIFSFVMVGVCALNNVSGPVNFTLHPLVLGKEK
jgi:hypothetical protein